MTNYAKKRARQRNKEYYIVLKEEHSFKRPFSRPLEGFSARMVAMTKEEFEREWSQVPVVNEQTYSHECIEWDGMLIDKFCPEFACCGCFADDEAKSWRRKHNDEMDRINEQTKEHNDN